MTDRIKVLGQIAAAGTTDETLYTTPSLAVTTCSTLVVCNTTGGALTVRVSAAIKDAAAPSAEQYLYYGKSVPANDSLFMTIGMTLSEGDAVNVWTSAAGISFTLFGVETS